MKLNKILFISVISIISSNVLALSKEEICTLSLYEQVDNITKLKKTQNQLIKDMTDSMWISRELITEVKRTNEETFNGLDSMLIKRNKLATQKDWDQCNSPQYKYVAFETLILYKLAIVNVESILLTNKYSDEIKKSSSCKDYNSCNSALFKFFRQRQIESSAKYLDEIAVAKEKTLSEINKKIKNNNK